MGMSDSEHLRQRGVPCLVHFTALSNVRSILEHGLQSPRSLRDGDIAFDANDEARYDGDDHVNASITNPNQNLFYTFQKKYPSKHYAVLEISLDALDEVRHRFTSTNAASNKSDFVPVEALFEGDDRPEDFERDWTTDNQAEVLLYDGMPARFIKTVVCDGSGGGLKNTASSKRQFRQEA